jgi:hypothetical protein
MRNSAELFAALGRSSFRSRFRLRDAELRYLREKGVEQVLRHAADFIARRLAPAVPPNDGKQTPWRGHPVFVAQHATATCCRGCLAKWHDLPKGRELTADEQRYVVGVIEQWIARQAPADAPEEPSGQQRLWPS